jgi:CDGSH-type Zn-finger protein
MVTITVRPNGPYIIEGADTTLIDWNGHEYRLVNRVRFALCRCGGSSRKPFCDGTHSRICFRSAEAAAPVAEAKPEE